MSEPSVHDQAVAADAARTAHPETIRTGEVKPGTDGVPVLIAPSSSNIHGIGFADGALFLRFQAGKVYRYTSNSCDMHGHYTQMMHAESAGSYFARNLRNAAHVACIYIGRVHEAPPA